MENLSKTPKIDRKVSQNSTLICQKTQWERNLPSKFTPKSVKWHPKQKIHQNLTTFEFNLRTPTFQKMQWERKFAQKTPPKTSPEKPQNVKIFTILSVTNIFELWSFSKTTKCLPWTVILKRPLDWKKLIFDTFNFANFNTEDECQFLRNLLKCPNFTCANATHFTQNHTFLSFKQNKSFMWGSQRKIQCTFSKFRPNVNWYCFETIYQTQIPPKSTQQKSTRM